MWTGGVNEALLWANALGCWWRHIGEGGLNVLYYVNVFFFKFLPLLYFFFRTHGRDHWNAFDLLILVIYIFALLPLRIVTLVDSESVNNNTNLAIAGYLYGFNTMLLTFRAFGSILEKPEGIGTIQIAFFHIIGDAVLVVLHFLVMTLAFASAITKVFVTEKTMASEGTSGKQPWVLFQIVYNNNDNNNNNNNNNNNATYFIDNNANY